MSAAAESSKITLSILSIDSSTTWLNQWFSWKPFWHQFDECLVLLLKEGEGDSLLSVYPRFIIKSLLFWICFHSAFHKSESIEVRQWLILHRPMTRLYERAQNTDESSETDGLYLYLCMRLMAASVPRSHYWLQSLLLPPDFHFLASRQRRQSQ